MLNKFHNALTTCKAGPLPKDCVYPTNENLGKRLQRLYQIKDNFSGAQFAKIESLYDKIVKRWERENTNHLVRTIIHDDWHFGNLLYHQDGSVAVILDYDNIQRGERIYGIAYAMYFLYKVSILKSNKMPKLFFEHYGELLSEEKKVLPLAIGKVCLFTVLWSAENFNNELDSYLKKGERLIYFLEDIVYR